MQKMNAYQLILTLVSCVLIFSDITSADNVYYCQLPKQFEINLGDRHALTFYKNYMTVQLNNDLRLTPYRGNNTIDVKTNKVVIEFTGKRYRSFEKNGITYIEKPELFTEMYVNRLRGVAPKVIEDSSNIDNCRIILLNAQPKQLEARNKIANKIRRLAESCLERQLCAKIKDMAQVQTHEKPGLVSSCPDPSIYDPDICNDANNTDTATKIFNVVIDVGISEAAAKLNASNNGTINLPNINITFSNGVIDVDNGTLFGLTNLKRASDVSFSRENMTWIVSLNLDLSQILVTYHANFLKYLIFWTSDIVLEAFSSTKEINVLLVANYSSNPCRLELKNLESKLETISVVVRDTDGGNHYITTAALSYLAYIFKPKIITALESWLRDYITGKMASVECERYRRTDLAVIPYL